MAEKLAERVRQGRQQPANGGTVATTDEGAAALVAAVRRMQPQYEIAVGSIRGATADQLVRDATTLIRRTPRLAECNRDTVLGGLMSFAQFGLRVGTPLGRRLADPDVVGAQPPTGSHGDRRLQGLHEARLQRLRAQATCARAPSTPTTNGWWSTAPRSASSTGPGSTWAWAGAATRSATTAWSTCSPGGAVPLPHPRGDGRPPRPVRHGQGHELLR